MGKSELTKVTFADVVELVNDEFRSDEKVVYDAALKAAEDAFHSIDVDWVTRVFQDSFMSMYEECVRTGDSISLEDIQAYSDNAMLAYIEKEMLDNYEKLIPSKMRC